MVFDTILLTMDKSGGGKENKVKSVQNREMNGPLFTVSEHLGYICLMWSASE